MPAGKQSFTRFASLLADNLHHSSIKVYLSAVWSLHIDSGLPDPLVNCLQLQRLFMGIKRVQGSSPPTHLPITNDLLQIIQRSLDLKFHDHVMLWAVCCLGFFGFLFAGKFTTNSSFDPSIHLAVSDVQADALVDPTCFRVHIKSSKTDPFRVGCVIYVGCGNSVICPVAALGNFLALRGLSPELRNSAVAVIHGAVYFTLSEISWFLLRSQLPDWCGHYSCGSGSSRSPHQDFRPVVE